MPPRLVSLAILIYWSVAAFFLLTGEILPGLTLGYPPDLRAIAMSGDEARTADWTIQVVDDPKSPEVRRDVGEARSVSRRLPDGWFELTSRVTFDAGGLLRGTPFGTSASLRVALASVYRVDPSGNLRAFDLKVTPRGSPENLLKVEGRLKGGTMEVVSRGPLPVLNQELKFPYEPRSVVSDSLGPLDRLPGLHVGQRWETRVVNPFSGQVEEAKVVVRSRTLINWNNEPVSAFEVVQEAGPLVTRTWVKTDGTILRQEVPFPFVRLVLERKAEAAQAGPAPGAGEATP